MSALRAGIGAGLVCLALASCSTQSSPDPGPGNEASTPAAPGEPTDATDATDAAEVAELSYGVFGSEAEIAASQAVVDTYNAQATTVDVTLRSWPSSASMVRAIANGAPAPDVYQVARTELATVTGQGLNVPLFSLLEERDISYGDNYPLDTIEAFSLGNDLQCMPYGISPTVMYLNTDLVDFDRMRQRGLPVPSDGVSGWDFEQFAAAADFATRPRLGTRGLSVEPTLEAIAPYLYSGGGTLFNDDVEPTSLDLASGDNQDTLATLLTLARNPLVTLTDTQLSKATPQEWFERGRLGMLEGDRSLTPALRAVPGLSFDVMLMPRISRTATTGVVTGICISSSGLVQRSADFLVHLISPEGFAPIAEAGYVVPANTSVARSEVFLQPGREPANSGVFNASVDAMELLPLATNSPALQRAVGPLVESLFSSTLPPDLEVATEQIDEVSRSVLDPDYVPELLTPSPSPTPFEAPPSEEP